jgi:hypothetical protein
MLLLYFRGIGWSVGAFVGGFVVWMGILTLSICYKRMRERRQRQRNAANAMLLLREITYQLT